MQWRTKPGIPGCWGENGTYYDESYTEAQREAWEAHFKELRRESRRRMAIRILIMAAIILTAAAAIVARVLQLVRLQ